MQTQPGGPIRTFGVSLLAVAALAALGLVLRRRHQALLQRAAVPRGRALDRLRAAGL